MEKDGGNKREDVCCGSCEEAWCIADGNEVMRFYCLGFANNRLYEGGGYAWSFSEEGR